MHWLPSYPPGGDSEESAAENLIVRIELNQPLNRLPQTLANQIQGMIEEVLDPLQTVY